MDMLLFKILHLLITSNCILEPVESFADLIWTLLFTAFTADLVRAVSCLKGLFIPPIQGRNQSFPIALLNMVLCLGLLFPLVSSS